MMNDEYIEHAIRHCRAYGLNKIADEAAAELARLKEENVTYQDALLYANERGFETVGEWMTAQWERVEQAEERLRAIEAAAREVSDSGIVYWLDGWDDANIKRCSGCDFVWGEGHDADCKVGKLAAALKESENQ